MPFSRQISPICSASTMYYGITSTVPPPLLSIITRNGTIAFVWTPYHIRCSCTVRTPSLHHSSLVLAYVAAKPLCQAVHVYNSVHLPSRRRSQELATRQPIHLMRHGYNAGGGSDVWQLYDAHAIVFRSSRGCGITRRVLVASAARR